MSRRYQLAALFAIVVLGGSLGAVLAAGRRAPDRARAALPTVPVEQRTLVTDERIFNLEAPIPPQCYTKTEGRHNPCYTCHQIYDRKGEDRLNQLDDGSLQGDYGFSDVGVENHWTNLFVDRRPWLAAIDDETIRAYVDEDNYTALASQLRARGWKGFVPDLRGYADGAAAFDERGLARDGSGWVALNYKPFPGTFWPTNGSADDVVIRLPPAFRELNGTPHRDAYFVNLTRIELNIKRTTRAPIWPIDEAALGSDVDGDGALGTATTVAMAPSYVGDARDVAVEFQQLPKGTELMHSVRYLAVADRERVVPARRMKELRYMRKVNVLPRSVLIGRYANERKEKLLGELPSFLQRGDEGLDNAQGWFIKGFIEDYDGALRSQSFEEDMFCMGCHAAIGTTIDSTFSIARKLPGTAGFGYINLVGMADAPSASEPSGEILTYLKRAGGGSEFRENPEMLERWYRADGTVDEAKVKAADVYTLTTPSVRRALDLDKAYTQIVRHQSYRLGRDATWVPARNVFDKVDEEVPPLRDAHRHYGWDLRLQWPNERESSRAP